MRAAQRKPGRGFLRRKTQRAQQNEWRQQAAGDQPIIPLASFTAWAASGEYPSAPISLA